MSSTYDYIIAGGGASGLNLALAIIEKKELLNKSVLILEKSAKNLNDRTWCFWEAKENSLESILYKKWHEGLFYSKNCSKNLYFSPYSYKMLRGIDFYAYARQKLSSYPNITWKQESILKIENNTVQTECQTYQATYIFNSIAQLSDFQICYPYIKLLQHFKGWFIQTQQPSFTPQKIIYMDFRVKQYDDCRFCYVLPFNEYEALVEYTAFSEQILLEEQYEKELSEYVSAYLNISHYKILHTEFGTIPMTDFPFPKMQSPHCIAIGTCAGQTKPSTGYTFLRTQQHARAIAQRLASHQNPYISPSWWHKRFLFYDKIMLDILHYRRCKPYLFFEDLFQKNSIQKIFQFLDEETFLYDELSLMSSVPLRAATISFIHQLFLFIKTSLSI
ncbi:MAG: lycopene cyclase family protein [Cytophagales bacterium]|nr:lycopene cyclase family protein [Cytophagales bacterium]MDW8385266.1 lycopene cyclase family protein [Flammeovirgaceae bacterium]